MSFRNLEICRKMMFLIGLNVDKGRGIIQFIWYWSINIAGIVITYLAILLLLQKPDLTMKDCIDMVSSISTSIHVSIAKSRGIWSNV